MLLTESDFAAIGLSLRVSFVAVALSLPPCCAVALWLARSRSRWRSVVETVVVLPLVLPPVVVGVVLLSLASWSGLGIVFTWWAAVVASAVVSAPLMIRTLRAGLETIDPQLAQVAATLGASRLRILRTVTLPLVWPSLVGGVTLAWARALGEFGATLIVAGNISGRTQTIPLAMYTGWQASDRPFWPLAVVSIVIALAAVSVGECVMRRRAPGTAGQQATRRTGDKTT